MADQTVTLRITANADGLAAGVTRARDEFGRFVKSTDDAKTGVRQLGGEGERAGKKLSDGMSAARQSVAPVAQQLALAKQAVMGFVGAFASIQGVRALVGMADTWSDLTSRVRLSIGAHESAGDVMRRLHSVAQQTYSSFELTAETYARNATTLNALGVSTQRQLDFTQALNNALVVSGAKADRAQMVQNSLAKAMAEGALRGEDFNNVVNYGSRVAEVLAEELGVNVTALRGLAADGKITGSVILNSLVKNMDALTEQAESMPTTVGDAFTLIRNSIMALVGQTDEAAGSTGWLAEQLVTVSRAIDIIAPEVRALTELWRSQDAEQEGVSTSAEDIAYGMRTAVTGLILAKNAVDVVVAAFRGLIRVAVSVVKEVVDAFEELTLLPDIVDRAWKSKSPAIVAAEFAAIFQRNMQRAKNIANEAGEAWKGVAVEFNASTDDVSRAFEFLEGGMRAAGDAAGDAAESNNQLTGTLADTADAASRAAKAKKSYADATREAHRAVQGAYSAESDLIRLVENQAAQLGGPAAAAALRYARELASIANMEAAIMALGPMTIEQTEAVARARTAAAELYKRELGDIVTESERAAEDSARAWSDFSYGLGRAVLDGSKGVKRYFKQLLDDLKAQLISSGLLRIFASIFGGSMPGAAAAAGQGGPMSMLAQMFSGQAMNAAGQQFGAGFMQYAPAFAAAAGGIYGLSNRGSSTGSAGSLAAGASYATAGWAVGTVGYGAALGYGAAGAAGAASGAMGAAAAVPVVGWIIAAIAAIDMITGGKVFGTRYRPESSESALTIGAGGGAASATLTEVRQRALFQGRAWRDRAMDPGDEARQAAQELYLSQEALMVDVFGRLRDSDRIAQVIDASIRTVAEYDKKGRETSRKIFLDILGQSIEVASAEEAAARISSESIIKAIDDVLGNTVDAAAAAVGTRLMNGIANGIAGPDFGDRLDNLVGQLLPKDLSASAGRTVGEASAIAERWRHDTELLATGAQFLLAVATDLRHGFDLLGSGTLTPIVNLVEELSRGGEPLIETYQRLAASTQLLDAALSMSGVQLDATREAVVRLAAGITDAVGGLDRAAGLWETYFATFFTAEERALFALGQAQQRADSLLGDLGFSAADFAGGASLDAFRDAFNAVLAAGDAAAIAQWLQAGEAVAHLLAAEQMLADARADSLAAAQAAAEAEARLAAERDAALRDYASLVRDIEDQLADLGRSEYQRQLQRFGTDLRRNIDAMHEAARAAGLQAARTEDLARAHTLAAAQAAQALAAMMDAGRRQAETLFGSALGDVDAAIAAHQAANGVRSFGSAMTEAASAASDAVRLLLGDLSPLRAVDKLPIAMDALRRGEVGAEDVLRIADRMYSGARYRAVFDEVQRIAATQAASAAAPTGPTVDGTLQALQAERERLVAEQNALQRYGMARDFAQTLADIAGSTGGLYEDILRDLTDGRGSLADMADALRLDGEDALRAFLDSLKAPEYGVASIAESLRTEFDYLLDGMRDIFLGAPARNDAPFYEPYDGKKPVVIPTPVDTTSMLKAEQQHSETAELLRQLIARLDAQGIAVPEAVGEGAAATVGAIERLIEAVDRPDLPGMAQQPRSRRPSRVGA